MAEIHLYGKLRGYTPEDALQRGLIEISPEEGERLDTLLQKLGIPEKEIYTVFYNSKLLATRNRMAPYLEYPQVRQDPHNWDLDIPIHQEDRLGLFGHDMPTLVV
jgi:hypothetical protein